MKKLSALCLLLSLLLLVQVVALPVFATDVPEDTTAPDASNSTPIGPAIAPQGQPLTVTDSDASVSHGCNSIDAQVPLGGSQKLLKTARAAILFELNSGTLLYSYNPDARMEPILRKELNLLYTCTRIRARQSYALALFTTENGL